MKFYHTILFSILSIRIHCQAIKYELCERLNLRESNSTCQYIMTASSTTSTNQTSNNGGNSYTPKPQCENCTQCKHSNYLCEFGCESIKQGVSLDLVSTYVQNLMGDDKCVDKARSKCPSCTSSDCNECITTSLDSYDRCQRWGTAFDRTTGSEMGDCFSKCNSTVNSYTDFFTCTFNCYLPGFKQINSNLYNITNITLNTNAASIKSNLDGYWKLKNICYDQSTLSIDNNTQYRNTSNSRRSLYIFSSLITIVLNTLVLIFITTI
jgi:hypothetical protein